MKTLTESLREFCKNWRGDLIKTGGIPEMLQELTERVFEHCVDKKLPSEPLKQRDELLKQVGNLKEALKEVYDKAEEEIAKADKR